MNKLEKRKKKKIYLKYAELEIRRESLIEELSHLHAVRRKYFEGMKNAAIEIATKMIEKGLDDELISEMTNLSIEEIIELRKNMI